MSRKVTVLVESTQSKVVFESNAATLGELKNELKEKQVNYGSDCVFKEAISKTILTSDESVLPSNIPWKGQVTNDLVFMITTSQKKIRSGIDRKEVYDKVRELGLQDKIQKGEGRNFTQCTTATLISYIEKAAKKAAPKAEKVEPSAPIAKEKVVKADAHPILASEKGIMSNLRNLLNEMVSKGVLMQHDADNIWDVANGQPALPIEREQSYDELAEQFDF